MLNKSYLLVSIYLMLISVFVMANNSLNYQIESELLQQKKSLLADRKANLANENNNLQQIQQNYELQLQNLSQQPITEEQLAEIKLEQESLQIRLENLLLQHKAAINQRYENAQDLATLQEQLHAGRLSTEEQQRLREHIELKQQHIDLEQNIIDTINAHAQILTKALEFKTLWVKALRDTYAMRQQLDKSTQANLKQQHYLQQVIQLKQRLETARASQIILIEAQIYENEELAAEVIHELKIDQITQKLQSWQHEDATDKLEQLPIQQAEHSIANRIEQLSATQQEIESLSNLLGQKIELNQRQRDNLASRSLNWSGETKANYQQADKILEQVYHKLNAQYNSVLFLVMELDGLKENSINHYKDILHKKLIQRRQFLASAAAWSELNQVVEQFPNLLINSLLELKKDIYHALIELSLIKIIIFVIILELWLVSLLWLKKLLKRVTEYLTQVSVVAFIANFGLILVNLLQRNFIIIALSGSIFISLYFLNLPKASYNFVFAIILLGLGVQLITHLAYLLFSLHFETLPHYRNICHQTVWIIRLLGIISLVTILAHQWQVSQLALEIIDTVFMLSLAIAIIPAIHLRSFLLHILKKVNIKGYWLFVIRMMTLLTPLSFLAISLLGIIGYINLGWMVLLQAYWFLFVLLIWLIVQGFLRDFINFLKNFVMLRSRYGLLWTQDIIPLGHNLLNISLFFLAFMLLSWLNNWDNDLTFATIRQFFLEERIIQLGQNHISLMSILLSILGLWVIFWFGSWFKRITYRWVYASIRDLGIRNSLSVFTQYFIILIGLLLILQVLGIDLTTMTVFAGALGVGIGFGLQNIANNFISGILLLIERPLKSGDYVNVGGNYEGEVMRIGIRASTIRAWNYQEIIVPNSEIISNVFTNWTLTDPIMRTTLYFRVGYENDPHVVRNLLLDLLLEIPEILDAGKDTDVSPSVNLWEFSEYAIVFRMDYYVDIKEHGLFKTRTKVNFLVWDKLRQAGIKIPYPQHDIWVKQGSGYSPMAMEKPALQNLDLNVTRSG
jgi:potassium-dependent mechanosensitive channel